jgi:hypothetical protein
MEPVLNVGAEAQAINRVHRIGQTSTTFVHRLVIADSVEERIMLMAWSRHGGGGGVDTTDEDAEEGQEGGGAAEMEMDMEEDKDDTRARARGGGGQGSIATTLSPRKTSNGGLKGGLNGRAGRVVKREEDLVTMKDLEELLA